MRTASMRRTCRWFIIAAVVALGVVGGPSVGAPSAPAFADSARAPAEPFSLAATATSTAVGVIEGPAGGSQRQLRPDDGSAVVAIALRRGTKGNAELVIGARGRVVVGPSDGFVDYVFVNLAQAPRTSAALTRFVDATTVRAKIDALIDALTGEAFAHDAAVTLVQAYATQVDRAQRRQLRRVAANKNGAEAAYVLAQLPRDVRRRP